MRESENNRLSSTAMLKSRKHLGLQILKKSRIKLGKQKEKVGKSRNKTAHSRHFEICCIFKFEARFEVCGVFNVPALFIFPKRICF